jgi:hypothetical protein
MKSLPIFPIVIGLFLLFCSGCTDEGCTGPGFFGQTSPPDRYCSLNISHAYGLDNLFYPQVNQRLGHSQYSIDRNTLGATMLNGFDTTIIYITAANGDVDTVKLKSDREVIYNGCDEDLEIRFKSVFLVFSTCDSVVFAYRENEAELEIVKP